MTWNEDDVRRLLLFKDKSDADEVRIKEIIKQNLLNDKYILHVLERPMIRIPIWI